MSTLRAFRHGAVIALRRRSSGATETLLLFPQRLNNNFVCGLESTTCGYNIPPMVRRVGMGDGMALFLACGHSQRNVCQNRLPVHHWRAAENCLLIQQSAASFRRKRTLSNSFHVWFILSWHIMIKKEKKIPLSFSVT